MSFERHTFDVRPWRVDAEIQAEAARIAPHLEFALRDAARGLVLSLEGKICSRPIERIRLRLQVPDGWWQMFRYFVLDRPEDAIRWRVVEREVEVAPESLVVLYPQMVAPKHGGRAEIAAMSGPPAADAWLNDASPAGELPKAAATSPPGWTLLDRDFYDLREALVRLRMDVERWHIDPERFKQELTTALDALRAGPRSAP